MALLKVLTAPDPRLHIVATPVAEVNDAVRKIMADMLETMYKEEGVGLAATQVGIDQRIIVMDVNVDPKGQPQPLKMANPEVIWASTETIKDFEACLSVPEQSAEVTRPRTVKVRYLDENGVSQEIEGDGLLAKCVQHEIDHLNGILFIDYLSRLKRDIIIRKINRLKRYN